MEYDAIVVGGGIAGLTSAAFLSKAGRSVLVCEKQNTCGGLINMFERDGFFFDGGIRATENSGVLFPMLRKLGLDIKFVHNKISIGIENKVIRINSTGDVEAYHSLLNDLYPESIEEISKIIFQIKKIMKYMEVQYSIENPTFLNVKEDYEYFLKTILPWMVKYAVISPKISRLQVPVADFLALFTKNQSLVDIIAQHFFQSTPAFFALSYISLYIDYHYPVGGTGIIPQKIVDFIKSHGGLIHTNTEVVSINPDKKLVMDSQGVNHTYRRLIWASDQKALYRAINPENLSDPRIKSAYINHRNLIADKAGNDSVFTLFLALDKEPAYFAKIASEHFFYTPSKIGQTVAGPIPKSGDRQTIEKWLEQYLSLTTYEITCPVLRDSTLAPAHKTGLIISVLFDYSLTKHIENQGWYEEFKILCETHMIRILDSTIYPGIAKSILLRFSSTPLTLEKYSSNTEGAIVGWAFTNNPMPAERRLPKILKAITTPIPGILQAGQWTYSPAGLPISLITGKLAADRVIRETGKK